MNTPPSIAVRIVAAILRPAIRVVLDELSRQEAEAPPSDREIAWSSGRRPTFWRDVEVRDFLIASHRQMTVDEAVTEVTRRFGAKRAPSRSAVGRFWKTLDAKGGVP